MFGLIYKAITDADYGRFDSEWSWCQED